MGLLVWRLPDLVGSERPAAPVSRESAFLFNNVLFLGITFAVLFGTLYPLAVQAVSGDTVSVGAPWFDLVNAPLFLLLLFLMGVGPALPWGAASWGSIRDRLGLPVIAGVAGVIVALAAGMRAPRRWRPLVSRFSSSPSWATSSSAARGRGRGREERRRRWPPGGWQPAIAVAMAVTSSTPGSASWRSPSRSARPRDRMRPPP